MVQDTAPSVPPARAAPRRTPFADLGSWTAFAVFVIVAWEIGSRAYNQPYLLPAPSQIIAALREDAPLVLFYAGITTQETVLGFVAGSVLALLGAMLFVWLPRALENFLYRAVVTLNSTPFVALASLVVVWFGLGITSKVVIAGLYTFFAVLYHAHKEFISVDPMREYLMDVYNASWLQRMLLLKLPSALPIIFTSLKGGVMAAVNGAIVGELFGAFEGLGYMILDSRYVGNTVRVFLAAVFCTMIGWVLLGIVTVAERLLLPWHVSMVQERP
ncbi:MAG: ABC transporter permease [Bacillati bacterium ANGP1]|uniref:ABC transporter permease n=1 Tax=Candidatus Segetimicrobium genomatis TaxID=2569760 RepID=A0A537IPY1_9BACT|nr:MAG: ABC transporter permease [Terrabacteria group bacterium ANGP1]